MPPKRVILLAPSRSTDGKFPDFQGGMYLGGGVRMEAAATYMQANPETELTIVGGYNKVGEGEIGTSDKVNDMVAFLLRALPSAIVRPVYSLPCTHHNFVAVFNEWKASGQKVDEIGILTNAFHLPRAEVFARQAAAAIRPEYPIRFVHLPAEAILGRSISTIVGDQTDEYAARMASERRGLEQLEAGTYQESCLGENLEAVLTTIHAHADMLLTPEELALVSP